MLKILHIPFRKSAPSERDKVLLTFFRPLQILIFYSVAEYTAYRFPKIYIDRVEKKRVKREIRKEKTLSNLLQELKFVWKIAWPLILTNMLNVLVGLVDFKMVGVLGVSSIAAVGMSRQIMMFLMVIMIAISGGSSVLIAHAFGANDHRKISQIAARSVMLMFAAAIFIITPLGLLLSKSILSVLGGDEQTIRMGNSYLQVLFAGSIFTMFNFALNGILLGVGKTKVSLMLLLVVNILNIGFNYIFIFGLHVSGMSIIEPFGVTGAAIGTITARGIGFFIGLWILKSPRFLISIRFSDGLVFDFDLLKKIIKLGGPRSLQGVTRNFSRLLILRVIAFLPDSTRAISAYSVGMQVKMISSFIGLAFMSASMARVGQNMGAGNIGEAEKSGWISSALAAGIMTIAALFFLLLPEQIMAFFTDDREVIALGRSFFLIIALTEPIMAFAFALGGALRGGGDALSPLIYGSISDLVVFTLVGYVLAVPLGMGFPGIAIGLAVSSVTRAVPSMIRFKQGKWKKNRLV